MISKYLWIKALPLASSIMRRRKMIKAATVKAAVGIVSSVSSSMKDTMLLQEATSSLEELKNMTWKGS